MTPRNIECKTFTLTCVNFLKKCVKNDKITCGNYSVFLQSNEPADNRTDVLKKLGLIIHPTHSTHNAASQAESTTTDVNRSAVCYPSLCGGLYLC